MSSLPATSDTEADRPTLRDRLRRMMRPPRQLALTTAGKFFILITLGVGFGAINTGNNLLFLLLGMLLSIIVVSGILSEAVLRELRAVRRLPTRIVAGTSAPGSFILENPRGYASLSILVEDPVARGISGPARGETVGFEPIVWWKVWKSPGDDDLPLAAGYSLKVSGGETQSVDARWHFQRRGRYRIPRLAVRTRFPFALFDKSRDIDEEAEVTVFPEPLDASDWARTVTANFGDVDTNSRGRGDEYYGLRDHREEDDARRVHWKVSAKRGKLVVRENEEKAQRAVEVALAHWHPGTPDAASLDDFEVFVRRTAGLIGILAQEGYRVGLRLGSVLIEPGTGGRHIDRIMSELAVVELQDELEVIEEDESVGRILIGPRDAIERWGLRADVVIDEPGGER